MGETRACAGFYGGPVRQKSKTERRRWNLQGAQASASTPQFGLFKAGSQLQFLAG